MFDKKITMVFEWKHSTDDYYEDDFGHECHTLNSEHKIDIFDVDGIIKASKIYRDILESNADDPPYREVKFIKAWFTESKEPIPKHYLEHYYEEEEQCETN